MAEKFPTFLQKSHENCFNLTIKGQDLKRFTMLGQKLRELREAKGLVQRQVAAELEVDTAYVSKIETNEKPVSRQHLKKLSVLLGIAEDELLILWLADKVYDVVKDEEVAIKAMHVAEDHVLKTKNKKRKS
jgi:transcriptional regulator with XRE-family HTH domain